MASTILVSSNTTNVVIAQAFKISFARYTASVVVPVVVTAVLLFPLLLYIIFASVQLIPPQIKVRELSAELRARLPINPHIPNARGYEDTSDLEGTIEQFQLEPLMNPFLDKKAAILSVSLMLTSLTILLILTALGYNDLQVFWVTLPASFIMFCWDFAVGWSHRHETREIARKGLEEIETTRVEYFLREREEMRQDLACRDSTNTSERDASPSTVMDENDGAELKTASPAALSQCATFVTPVNVKSRLSWPYKARHIANLTAQNGDDVVATPQSEQTPQYLLRTWQGPSANAVAGPSRSSSPNPIKPVTPETGTREPTLGIPQQIPATTMNDTRVGPDSQIYIEAVPQTFEDILNSLGLWFQQTLPSVAYTARHIPFSNIPFALPLFILVQSLASTGWVTIMARGWDSWVDKTGTIGSICGMAFLSMVLCNVSHLLQLTSSIKKRSGSDHRSFAVRRHKYWGCYTLFTRRARLAGPPSSSRPTDF